MNLLKSQPVLRNVTRKIIFLSAFWAFTFFLPNSRKSDLNNLRPFTGEDACLKSFNDEIIFISASNLSQFTNKSSIYIADSTGIIDFKKRELNKIPKEKKIADKKYKQAFHNKKKSLLPDCVKKIKEIRKGTINKDNIYVAEGTSFYNLNGMVVVSSKKEEKILEKKPRKKESKELVAKKEIKAKRNINPSQNTIQDFLIPHNKLFFSLFSEQYLSSVTNNHHQKILHTSFIKEFHWEISYKNTSKINYILENFSKKAITGFGIRPPPMIQFI